MNTAQARGESLKRLSYINEVTSIMTGHWGGWLLTSHPHVSSVRFNRDLTKALVFYRIGYGGGEALFVRDQNKWNLESFQKTWVE